jgi:hypothetical protein
VANSTYNNVTGVNAAGEIIGSYKNAAGKIEGFAEFPGHADTAIDLASSTLTNPNAINASGAVAGAYEDSAPSSHGFTTNVLAEAVRGTPYSQQLIVTGGTAPYKWKKTAVLPKGLRLSSTGLLTGTPGAKIAGGNYSIYVQVTDSTPKHRQVATAKFTMTLI